MSNKRKSDNSNTKQAHPQKTFQDYVADATLAKLGGYIDSQIQGLGQNLAQRQAQMSQNMLTRIVALEEVIMENLPAITKDTLANRVATVQDRNEGFETVTDGGVELGDRVRLEIRTKTADQTDFQGTSRLLIDNTGTGQTLGSELENAIVGMATGETKEIKFGKDQSLTASLTLSRISRAPEKSKGDAKPDSETPEADDLISPSDSDLSAPPPSAEGVVDASANAG